MEKLIKKADALESSLKSLKAEYNALVKATKINCSSAQRQAKREMEADIKISSQRLESAEYDIAHAQYYGVTA